ncbi:MAG: DUF1080 domain-containing protein [bacterium]|nr:DUF1080 domain-containing protein [bacterium]
MKIHTLLISVAACVLLASCATMSGSNDVDLFDGCCLKGWSHFLVDDGVKMEDVWSVEDGILVCKGEPLGYLLTKSSFQDYHLVIEWRWAPGTKPGNSGVLLRIAGDSVSFLPKCVEAQLQSGSAGDIWAFYGAKVEGDAGRTRDIKGHKDLGDFKGIGKIKAAEKPAGEWNRYDILVTGGDLELRVNGELVNQATGLDVLSGPIGLQSEGGEIHFRTIRLTKQG